MRAILDTNLLVADSLAHPGFQVGVSCLSWAELGFGIRRAQDPVQRARREARLIRIRALLGAGVPFDEAAAEAFESVCGLVLDRGRQVRGRAIDLMIASTAAAQGAALLTRNAADFAGLEDLIQVIVV